MAELKRKLFRAEAIDRLSSPDDLESLMSVAGSKDWLLILTIGALLALFVAWCFLGTVSTTVEGRGVILRPERAMQVQTTVAGRILSMSVRPGDHIRKGDLIATLDQSEIVKRLEENRLNLARLEDQDGRQGASEQHHISVQTSQDEGDRAGLEAQRNSLQKNLNDAVALQPVLAKHRDATRSLVKEGLMGPAAAEPVAAETAVLDNDAKIRSYTAQLKQLDGQLGQIETRGAALSRQVLNDSLARRDEMAQMRHSIELDEFQLQHDGKIRSDYSGRITELMATAGQVLPAGATLFTLEADNTGDELESIAYFPVKDGKKIHSDMEVQIIPDTVERERYGGILGTVSGVSSEPVTKDGALRVVGNTEIVQSLMTAGPYIEVRVRMDKDPGSLSGYKWSSSRGPEMKITEGLTHAVRVQVEQRAPITYLLPVLREITGVY
jgi:HlyD family secretion protein